MSGSQPKDGTNYLPFATASPVTSQRLRCGHDVRYQCPICRQCFQCDHLYKEIEGVWMVRCLTIQRKDMKFWRPAFPTGAGAVS